MTDLDGADVSYLISRLEAVIGHLNAGNEHMAIAKILADISALRARVEGE